MSLCTAFLVAVVASATPPDPAPTNVAPPEQVAPDLPAREASPAGPCATSVRGTVFEGPVAIGYAEADVTTGRRACPRSELSLGARGGLVVDTPGFYGAIAADALVAASYALGQRAEVFGALELLHYQWVQNGTLKGSATSLGQATLGASLVTHASASTVGATSVRLMLPTSTASAHLRTVGLEVGHSATHRRNEFLELHAELGADLSAGLSEANPLARLGIGGLFGVELSPLSWLAFAADAQARVGATRYLAPAFALRVRGRQLGAELGFTLPLVGTDRHDALAALRFAYRFN